jgi:hypothetical protein
MMSMTAQSDRDLADTRRRLALLEAAIDSFIRQRGPTDREWSGLLAWLTDADTAIDEGDHARAQRDIKAAAAWITTRATR